MRRTLVFLIAWALLTGACGDATTNVSSDPTLSPTPETLPLETLPLETLPLETLPWPSGFGDALQRWTVRIVDRIPHDTEAFTQGLEMSERGLLEGTGQRGSSSLRVLDPVTGAIIDQRAIDDAYFGEGLTVADDVIIQLTWEAGRALRYDVSTLQPLDEFVYSGEGWGICAGPTHLWMSDGTPGLQRRDPESFELLGSVTVRREGEAVDDLNELECIGDHVVANVWKSDEILVIEPMSGTVVATIDARVLAEEIRPTDGQAVLNGVADVGDGTLILGGKLWPTLFVVVVEPAA